MGGLSFPRHFRAEPRGMGLIVALSRIDGLTNPRVLGTPFYFQCAPLDSMPADYTWAWDDYITIDGTTHSNPQARALDGYSFSTLFVDDDTNQNFTLTKNQHVLELVKTLRTIGDNMTPFQMQYGQPRLWGVWDVVTAVTMRSLHVEERHGEVDARYITVSFSSYSDSPVTLKAVPPPAPVSAGGRALTQAQPETPGVLAILDAARLPDTMRTLADISKAYYHDPGNWVAIAKASGLTNTGPTQDLKLTIGAFDPSARILVPVLAQTAVAE